MSETLEVIIAARDQFTGTANRVIGSLNRMDSASRRVGKGIGQVAGGLARIGMIAGTAVVGGLVASAKAFSDYEAQLNTINTIARTTPAELDKIGQSLRTMAREGRGDLADLSAGFYDVLSAGITDTTDALGLMRAATDLAKGGLSTNAEAVDILTTAINSYGLAASEAGAAADMFAKAIEVGKVTAPEIAASLASVAPVAATFGIELNEIAAAYGRLTAQGTNASEVTTQMARAIIELNKPSADLLALQKETGRNYAQLAKDKGLVPALEQMRIDAEKAKIPFQELFGRIEAFKFAVQTTGPQFAAYTEALQGVDKSQGTAAEQAAERMKGLSFSFGKLKANLIDMAITVGEGFAPALGRVADRLSEFLDGNRDKLKAFGKEIGSALDGVDWAAVLRGAEQFVGILKTAWSIVNSLPGEVKAAGAAFLAADKLSGGLLGRGAGNIIGGAAGALAGGATRGLAAKIPGVGSIFAQPVFVTNWPVGGIGAGGGGIGAGAAGAAAPAAAGLLAPGLAPLLAMAAAPLLMYQVIPKLVGSKPGTDQAAINVPGAGTVAEGPSAGMVRLFTPALAKLDAIKANIATGLVEDRAAWAADRAQLAGVRDAARESATAIRGKDMSVNVKIPVVVNNRISVRELRVGTKTTVSYNGNYGAR